MYLREKADPCEQDVYVFMTGTIAYNVDSSYIDGASNQPGHL